MNILFVDDDVYVIEAMKTSLHWQEIGIDNCYYAYSVEQAKSIMEDADINILVSDIEMPHQNAFALLDWIREKGFLVQEILLTMYAEFSYAKQAIQYNCFAYVLKPVNYDELADLIRKAMEKEKQELENRKSEYYRKMWDESEKLRKEFFFRNILRNRKEDENTDYALHYADTDVFRVLCVYNYGEAYHYRDASQGMAEWESRSLLRECFAAEQMAPEAVFLVDTDYYALILKETDGAEDRIRSAGTAYFKKLREKRGMDACIFVSRPVMLQDIQKGLEGYARFVAASIPDPREIWFLSGQEPLPGGYQPPDFRRWNKLLQDGESSMLMKEAAAWVRQQKADHTMSRDSLRRVIGDFMQMIYAYLREKGVVLYEMEEPVFSDEMYQCSILNAPGALLAMEKMVEMSLHMMENGQGDKSVLDTVQEYIDQHCEEEMTRESLAQMVYLNPDYLARIFKKKTGFSVGAYIQEKRLVRAEEYLRQSGEPVNMIAAKCGYDNFSYFTKVFKARTGFTPKDYRKEYGDGANV
jgi:two-component system response regulator YesN